MTKDEMLSEYEVDGFFYDLCIVTRKSDGVRGTLKFEDDYENGRNYHSFQADSPAIGVGHD